jgi:myo-inositol-1(or 4)-monophosphatase
MRLLLAGHTYYDEVSCPDIDHYLASGATIVVNLHALSPLERKTIVGRYSDTSKVIFESFNPAVPQALRRVIARGRIGFDAIVCSPDVTGLSEGVLADLAEGGRLTIPLRVIGCPNDSIAHLAQIVGLATRLRIPIIHTPGVHARSVAEYTLAQMASHARRLQYFGAATGRRGAWPHDEVAASTELLQGKTLGVIGASGKDGSAVVELAAAYGLRVAVVDLRAGSDLDRAEQLGADVSPTIDALLERSDFVSINCRHVVGRGVIGRREIALMRPGVVVVNASDAENIDRSAVVREFSRDHEKRTIASLVLDMPYGGRRDGNAFVADPVNARLKGLGVVFTPRMAGYTVQSHRQATIELARSVDRYLHSGALGLPVANREAIRDVAVSSEALDLDRLLDDVAFLARKAGAEAIRLRDAGLKTRYKADGSPTTNADVAAETIVRSGLKERHYRFDFLGEEACEQNGGSQAHAQVVVDGIDGTRNFRDRNYGWCISIAVNVDGETLVAVVHDPQSRETFLARKGCGASIETDGLRRRCKVPSALPRDFSFSMGHVLGTSLKVKLVSQDINRLGGRTREWGSIALSICAVARGGLGVFIQSGSEVYDHAAGLLIALESGAHVLARRMAGSSRSDIIVVHPKLRARVTRLFTSRMPSTWTAKPRMWSGLSSVKARSRPKTRTSLRPARHTRARSR